MNNTEEVMEYRRREFGKRYGISDSMVDQLLAQGSLEYDKRKIIIHPNQREGSKERPKAYLKECLFVLMQGKTLEWIEKNNNKAKTIRVMNSNNKGFKGDCYLYRNDAMGGYLATYYPSRQVEDAKRSSQEIEREKNIFFDGYKD